MKINFLRGDKGFLTLLGLVISLLIICTILLFAINTYFKRLEPVTKSDKSGIMPNIATTNYQSIVDTTKKTLDAIDKQRQTQIDELMQKEQH